MRVTLLLVLSFTVGLGLAACSSGGSTQAVPGGAPANPAAHPSEVYVYVVSNGSSLVYKYTRGGQEVTTFAPPGGVPWGQPNAITYDSENGLLYVNGGFTNPISAFSTNGLYNSNFPDPGGWTGCITYDATDDALFIEAGSGGGGGGSGSGSGSGSGGAPPPPSGSGNGGIFKVSPSGELEAGPTGVNTSGVTYDSRDNLLFAVISSSSTGSAVAAYDTNLNLLHSWQFEGLTGMMLWNPASKLLYVGEQGNATIYAYKVEVRNNTVTLQEKNLSGGFSGLEDPVVMANDRAGNIYITDWTTQNVQVFDSAGNYLDSIGSGISGPWGVVVAPN